MRDKKISVDAQMVKEEMTNKERESFWKGALALGPLDGRYHQVGEELAPYFSEYALVKNRVKVEVLWLKFLLDHFCGSEIVDNFDKKRIPEILSIYEKFSKSSFLRVKKIESVTNHDVKAVELYVAKRLKEMGMEELVSYVHIGCTSEDINNTAYALMITEGISKVWYPKAKQLKANLHALALAYSDIPMLAHTHGQPATPTTVGKEMEVFAYRMSQTLKNIDSINVRAKFNGATGNYSAISVAFPHENWLSLAERFVQGCIGGFYDIQFNPVTTQIESHDYICHLLDGIRHFNNVLLDLDLDMWQYISMEYFKQIPVKTEVGSSTMPHKVNPIRFENSEANIDISNALLTALSNKLARSRMQRDLSDSSSMRNVGLAIGYSLQSIEQTTAGLKKVEVNKEKLKEDLDHRWEVLAEPIQTMLRKYGVPDAYNKLKEMTRGKNISEEAIHEFIESLDMLSEDDKATLLLLTPSTYIGYASEIPYAEYTK